MKKLYCAYLALLTTSLYPIQPKKALKSTAALATFYACGYLTAKAYIYRIGKRYNLEFDLLNSNMHTAWSDSLRTELIRIVLTKHHDSAGWFFEPSTYPLTEYKETLDDYLFKLSCLRIFCIGSECAHEVYQLRNWLSEIRAYIIQDSAYMQECRHFDSRSY